MRVNPVLPHDYNFGERREVPPVSADGESHVEGTCDNCGAVGKLGWVIGMPDKTHLHSCRKPECKEALERQQAEASAP